MTFRFNQGDRPLPGYTIERGVGRGGFGEVYYATSDGGKEVALKYLRENPQVELRGVAHCLNLKSPHLVALHDVKQNSEGDYFVIMEYVNGPSLRDLMNAEPGEPGSPQLREPGCPQPGLGPQKAAYFLREIGKGLTYLHDRGIVHRDLKPGNIFYEGGYVKIGDYGLAKIMAASQHSGQTVSVGTVHYMAPEVGSGNYDRTIDIYALGVILYEMLLGRVPFSGQTMGEVLMKHLTAQPAVDELPEPFPGVIRKALAKDPKDRYQTVGEMLGAVFAVEDLSNSVAALEPASLTTLAASAARQVHLARAAAPVAHGGAAGALGTGSSNVGLNVPPPVIHPMPTADRMGAAARAEARGSSEAARAETRDPAAVGRFGRIHDRISGGVGRVADRIDRSPIGRQVAEAAQRPAHWADRLLVALLISAGISFGASLLAAGGDPEFAVAVFLYIMVLVPGVILGGWLSLDRLSIRGKWLPRIIMAACVGAGLVPVALFVDEALHLYRAGQWAIAVILSVILCDWVGRFREGQKGRVQLGSAFSAGLFGFVAGHLFADEEGFPVAAIVAASSLALQAVAGLWPAGAGATEGWMPSRLKGGKRDDPSAPDAAMARRSPVPLVAVVPGSDTSQPVADADAAAPAAAEVPRRSTAVRSLWLVLSVLLLFGSVLAFSSLGFLRLSSDQEAACVVGGVIGSVYALFAISRVFPRTKRGLWRGVFRPAIFFTGLALAGGSGTAMGMFNFDGEEQLAVLAAIIAGGLVSLFVWFVPVPRYVPHQAATDESELTPKQRQGKHLMATSGLLFIIMMCVLPMIASLVPKRQLDVVMPAVSAPLAIITLTFLIVGFRMSRPKKATTPKLALPLRSVFEIDANPKLEQLIERHLTLLGYSLAGKSDLLWSFVRGDWAAHLWQSDVRRWKAKLNIAAYELDTGGCRLSCHLDVESPFNNPDRKKIAVLQDELADLRSLLGGRDAPTNPPEGLS